MSGSPVSCTVVNTRTAFPADDRPAVRGDHPPEDFRVAFSQSWGSSALEERTGNGQHAAVRIPSRCGSNVPGAGHAGADLERVQHGWREAHKRGSQQGCVRDGAQQDGARAQAPLKDKNND